MASESCCSTLADVFDELFAQDFESLKNVEKIYEEYKTKEKTLADSIGLSEEKTSNNLQDVMNSCEIIIEEIQKIKKEIVKTIKNREKNKTDTTKMKIIIKNKVDDVEKLNNEAVYQIWVAKIVALGSVIQGHIEKENIKEGVDVHVKLYKICAALQSTSCENLQRFSYDMCEKFYEQLKTSLESKLSDLLSTMKYPFPTGISAPCFNNKEEIEEQFKDLLTTAVMLESLSINSKYSLVSTLLANPLRKRFYFHFYGKRHTNDIGKPEWFFTQVLNWIRDHTSFIDGYVEPLLKEYTEDQGFEIKNEFLEILVELCKEKLRETLDETIEMDVLLAHLIDETMSFDKELNSLTTKPPNLNCIQVLLQEQYLEKWLSLEKHFAHERMTEQLQREEAWLPKFANLNVDKKTLEFYVPKCIEEFIALLSSMTARYENIYEKGVQRRFLEILKCTVDSFILELKHKASVERIQPESRCFSSIINGAYYIHHVLNEWANDLYFVTLFMSTEDNAADDEKTIFEDATSNLDRFINNLIECLVDYIKEGIQAKIKQYKAESWHALPNPKDYVVPALSPGACSMMLFVKEHLHMLEERLYGEVFDKSWRQFAVVIDKLLFDEIVLDSHFNEGGASQLQFDVRKNLYVLFGQYTSRQEAYFKLLKESCFLLNLMPGSALLIKEELKRSGLDFPTTSSKKITEKEQSVKAMLLEQGVKHLTIEQVSQIINSRVDWPKVT